MESVASGDTQQASNLLTGGAFASESGAVVKLLLDLQTRFVKRG